MMPKRESSAIPVRVRDSSDRSVNSHSLTPLETSPRDLSTRLSEQSFEHITANDRAKIVNGNIFYGNVVNHHPSAPAVPTEMSKEGPLFCEMREEREHRNRVKEEQRKLLEEAMESLLFQDINFRYATTQTALTETCNWISENPAFKKWTHRYARNKNNGCLWIRSKPGAGKSSLMKFAVQRAQVEATRRAEVLDRRRAQHESVKQDDSGNEDIIIQFFFNARGDVLERSAEGMYRSLVHQLVSQHREKRHRPWLLAHNKPAQNGWQWPLDVLQATFEDGVLGIGDARLTCYIDALDECDAAQIREIAAFFERLIERAAAVGVRFWVCIASRHYPHVTIDGSLEIVLDDEAGHRRDIERYISARLKIVTSDEQRIRAELQERAAGVFLWVVLVIKILNQESDRGRSYALRQRLREMPNDLNDLFQGILDSSHGDREEVARLLEWIMLASRPLRCQELYYAIRSDLEYSVVAPSKDGYPSRDAMAKFILHTSRGLAEVTHGPDPVVQFVHESVRTFLFQNDGWRFTRVGEPIGRSHERLKACCQTYISAAKRNSMDIASSEELPFLRYAVHGVLYHAHQSSVKQDEFVASFSPEIWMSAARLADPERFANASIDSLCIFAEASTYRLLELAVQHDERFTSSPGRYIEATGTVTAHRKPTEIELLLLGDDSEGSLEKERLNTLINMSLNARYTLVMVLLLQYRWEGHIKDELCLDFLTWALANEHMEVLELLVTHIAKLDGYAYSILELATEDGASVLVQMLLDKHTNSLLRERKYSRLLRTAVYLGHIRTVRVLLDRGADLHFSSRRYGHLLWIAAKAGHSHIVQLLCDRGAEIDRRAWEGKSTPLQVACFNRHVTTVDILLKCGADVTVDGAEYGTALEAAMYWPHSDQAKTVVQMLRRHGAVI